MLAAPIGAHERIAAQVADKEPVPAVPDSCRALPCVICQDILFETQGLDKSRAIMVGDRYIETVSCHMLNPLCVKLCSSSDFLFFSMKDKIR